MITIVDYGMGNLGSISNMLKKVGYSSVITQDIECIKKSTKLILPGVGAFGNGMKSLRELGLIEVLNQKVVKEKVPVLGICLGMQLMTNKSEEGDEKGLGWIDAEVIKEFTNKDIKIPHMGWNLVNIIKESQLFYEMFEENRFYFVHSYYVKCNNVNDVLTNTYYANDFVSSFQKDNILGVQFHPEKSHKFGIKLLRNFVEKF